jgi:hypothetical protein
MSRGSRVRIKRLHSVTSNSLPKVFKVSVNETFYFSYKLKTEFELTSAVDEATREVVGQLDLQLAKLIPTILI